jgi:AcrR family transcriptional regulator
VPRTRAEVERVEKVDQILDAAETRLLAGGYEHMSIAAIARELGLAQNSVYWYFGSKDELFVAVLRRLVEQLASTKPTAGKGLEHQVLWGVEYLHNFAPLRTVMRERAARSQSVAEFDAELTETLHRMLVHALEPYVVEARRDLAARTLMATVEGTFVSRLSTSERRRIVEYALQQIAGTEIAR